MLLKDLHSLAKASWAINSNPGANAQATTTRPAGGAVIRHVCTDIVVTLAAGAVAPAAAEVSVNLRDGATGAGNVLWTGVLAIPATAGAVAPPIMLSGMRILGSLNTPMTLEFAGAAGANTFEAVTLVGFDVSDG